jgi:Zn-dependent M28 family amino/carboxypeptidase
MFVAALPSRAARRGARALMAVAGLLMVESMFSRTAPGANDNATGVAAALELARRFAAEPLAHTEVEFVFPGGEEVGNTGMRSWMRDARRTLDPATTLVVNLDALGSGQHLVVSTREGLTAWYADDDVQLALREAAAERIELQPVTFPNVSDAFTARRAGLRVISMLSYADGWISNLHRAIDTPDNVRWNTIDDAIALTARIAKAWDACDA